MEKTRRSARAGRRSASPPVGRRRSVRRAALTAVAASLTASALLAVAILLFGDFGPTEGRILGTTMMLGAYGLLATPGALLLDQGRGRRLATAVFALAATALVLALTMLWSGDDPPEPLVKCTLTATVLAVAAAQTAALTARRSQDDSAWIRRLFAASVVAVVTAALMGSAAAWLEVESSVYFRILGSIVVLDALAVALQPVLAWLRPAEHAYMLRLSLDAGETVTRSVTAPDFASAVAKAIRGDEHSGRRVDAVERVGDR